MVFRLPLYVNPSVTQEMETAICVIVKDQGQELGMWDLGLLPEIQEDAEENIPVP